MKRRTWPLLLLLALLALSLQSCLGIGDNGSFKSNPNQNGQPGINTADQAKFSGKLYFVSNHTLYLLDGADNTYTPRPLTHNLQVQDPAVSPDGKHIAFIARYPNYSDLMLISSDGTNQRILRSGKGAYVPNPYSDMPKTTFLWYAQPSWHPDGKHLIFLSDLGKPYTDAGVDDFLHDPQIFSISLDNPDEARPQQVACAAYGGGGLRDPGYRPGHPDEVIYTSYYYDKNQVDLYSQLYLTDPAAVSTHPCQRVGKGPIAVDPAMPITPQVATIANQEPAFSPDGKSILYTRREDATHRSIYLMPVPENITTVPKTPALIQQALGSYNNSVKLLTDQFLSFPTWSPDGKQMAYVGYSNGAFDIWLATLTRDAKTGAYSIEPGSQVQLTNAGGQLDSSSRPCWMPE